MPIADLPYRIEKLAKDGQYAYLALPLPRKVPTDKPTKLRVLRNVNLCDGPTLWESKDGNASYNFYPTLRLFATPEMVEMYLKGPEVASYCAANGTELPVLKDGDLVISKDKFMSDEVNAMMRSEYSGMLKSREDNLSIESLEELVCQLQGVDSLEPAKKEEGHELKPKKRKSRATLCEQFVLVQNTPSRTIDVSKFGDSMQNQSGKVLDRVKHGERIAQCISLGLFPIISDNVAAFKRAINVLGSRHQSRIVEFETRFAERQKA
jgi:hypothetical protein